MRRPRHTLVFFALCLLLSLFACAQGDRREAYDSPDADVSSSQEPTEPSDAGKAPPKPENPDEALVPEITSLAPNQATVGSVGPSIIVSGTNFVPRTIIQLDGAPLATSFVSATELRATIPTSKLATVGQLRISVGTSPPGGGASKEVVFEVQNPIPALTQLDPLSVVASSSATVITLTGSGFMPGAKAIFGSTDLPTTLKGSTEIEATIPASLLVSSGSYPIKIVNPAPGGGASTTIAFTVANPSAAIQNINPSGALVGSASFQVVVEGSGFFNGSNVVFNGTTLATTFVSATQLKATVPSAVLGAAGDFPVTVSNPPPGGGVSTPAVFKLQYPAPSATSLSPASGAVGAAATDVTVTGIGFFFTSQVTLDGVPTATTYIDPTHLKASVPAAKLASAGAVAIRVVNAPPGGGTSNALLFNVTNAVPSITSLSPSSITVGSPDRAVTISGSGFIPSSVVKANGVVLPLNFVAGTQLTAVVPANLLQFPGSVAITVTNPAPGGGTSLTRNLSVVCGGATANVTFTSLNQVVSLSTSFATAPVMSRWQSAGSCETAPIDTTITRPGRYWTVLNSTPQPITLSTWADCTADGKKGDAYLTIYDRATAPANDTERLDCAYWVSEGASGAGGYASPESGASTFCPGLTKANGGGLALGVCERAVVHMQPWSTTSTTFTQPPTVRFKAE